MDSSVHAAKNGSSDDDRRFHDCSFGYQDVLMKEEEEMRRRRRQAGRTWRMRSGEGAGFVMRWAVGGCLRPQSYGCQDCAKPHSGTCLPCFVRTSSGTTTPNGKVLVLVRSGELSHISCVAPSQHPSRILHVLERYPSSLPALNVAISPIICHSVTLQSSFASQTLL